MSMPKITFKESNRRYLRAFVPVMVFYAVFCFAGPALLEKAGHPPKVLVVAVALLTAAPLVAVFWLMGRLLRETDEYTRLIQGRAMLTGGGFTLSFAGVWGFLEHFSVAPHLWPFLLIPLFFASYGVAMIIHQLGAGKGEPR
jgi:hypothetical protein